MSNKHIKDYASKGGKARAKSLTPLERTAIAKKAVDTRIVKNELNKQDDKPILPMPQENHQLIKEENTLLRAFITNKGGDPDEVIEQMKEITTG